MTRPTRLNILVVDDRPENREALASALESLGERVVCAASGEETLRYLMNEDFALILLDVLLPDMDGFETAHMIKSWPKTRNIPLIFMSATADTGSFQARGYALGAVDYLPMPFDPAFLRAKAAVFLELARQHAQLERQAAELALAVRYKDEFLSVVSHELKTPITTITGFTEILEDELDERLTPTLRGYLGQITQGANQMLALVNDLLDMGRIQAGRFAVHPAPADLVEVLQEANAQLATRARAKSQTFTMVIAEDLPNLMIDAGRIRQLVLNLLSNAIKFTPKRGGIEVHVCRTGDTVRCEVRDTGPGIPVRFQSEIFERFTQVDTSSTRAAGGTGLGLSISKAIVESHGGTIGVLSAPDAGSTFWFTLPVPAPAGTRRRAIRRHPKKRPDASLPA